jgi:hypothetical protein
MKIRGPFDFAVSAPFFRQEGAEPAGKAGGRHESAAKKSRSHEHMISPPMKPELHRRAFCFA